jgi:nucleoside-diphosphate-sugar epimerase
VDGGRGIVPVAGCLGEKLAKELTRSGDVEACIHAAWITTPGIYQTAPENQLLMKESYEFLHALQREGVRRFVVLGTCAEYATGREGSTLREEDAVLEPQNPYARSKSELHAGLVQQLEPETNLAWARIFFPYGKGGHPNRLISSILRKFSRGEKVILETPGNCVDFVHVSDVASALVTLLDEKANGPHNVGSGEGVEVRQVARLLAEMWNGPIEGIEEKNHEPVHMVADIERLRGLGWQPSRSLREGLESMVKSVQ